jgi:outer membrane protein OmpA-like peptidoglycan-associated protein
MGACALLALGSVLLAEPVRAQGQPSEAQILEALRPVTKTRSISSATRSPGDPNSGEEQRFIKSLRARATRSLTIVEREKVAAIARIRPSIDLEINFDYNSAVVGPQAVPVLVALGRALSRDEFGGVVFLINGHTDGKGSLEYNQDLSERRADAVKGMLVKQFNLPATTLIAIGYGKTQLKNAANPFAGENRRVQIVNTGVR